jgi:hypothetical protein
MMKTLCATLFGASALFGLSACSYQQTLDNMVSPARQGEIIQTAQNLCGNLDALQSQFDPTIWTQVNPNFRAQVQARCPTEPNVTWQVTNYEFSTSASVGAATDRTEAAAVVAGDADGPWTQVDLNFQQSGNAPAMIMNMNIERFETRPESLTGVEAWDSVRYYVLAGVLLVVLLPILLIVWIIRRRRRRRQGLNG